jgi:hypothetical protein
VQTPATTAVTVAPNPVSYGQTACRAFISFAGILAGNPEAGQDAAGELGGMVVEATEAVNAGHGAPRWIKLDNDLKALVQVADSAQWPVSTAAARLPQIAAVQSDCAHIGYG